MSTLSDAINRDMRRLEYGLLYALTHGGNMPPGFMDAPHTPGDAPTAVSTATETSGGAGEAQEAGQ